MNHEKSDVAPKTDFVIIRLILGQFFQVPERIVEDFDTKDSFMVRVE